MKKIIILSILIFIHFFKSAAQQVPTIIPPSPQAQAFMRYGEIPVDYSTGVPGISIPLYTLKEKKLELPISISYHASGIKVNDVASEVGLGWVLNRGGMISRTTYEQPDEESTGQKTYSNASELLTAVATIAPVYKSSCNCYSGIDNLNDYFNSNFINQDPLRDRFNYCLPNGTSGVFIFDYLNQNNIITLPFRPLKIEKTASTINPIYPEITTTHLRIVSFKITDENGIKYTFKSYNSQKTTEWYLTGMTSADGTESIVLNYDLPASNQGAWHENFSLVSHTNLGSTGTGCSSDGTTHSTISESPSLTSSFDIPVLTSIVSSNAVINFYYDTQARSDFTQLHRLSNITVTPVNSTSIIKNIRFAQKYFGSNATNYRLGLDSVIIIAPGNAQPQKYTFTYEAQTLPPYPIKLSTETFNEDFWGYYNGSNSPTLIQTDFISTSGDKASFGANREADAGNYSRACMIKEIKYPTGGKTVFQFDRNYAEGIYQYKSNQNGYVGGFRIGSITNYNEKNEVVNVKSYEYSGVHARPITRMLFDYNQLGSTFSQSVDPVGGWTTSCWIQYTDDILFSDPLLPLEVGSGLPVSYSAVTEYDGTKTNNAGKTVYVYNPPYSPSDFVNNQEHPLSWEEPRFYTPTHYDKGNFVPELISKTEYSFDGTNYHPVSKVNNVYTKLYTTEFQTGIKLTRTHTFPETVGIGYGGSFIQDFISSIVAIDTKAYQEASLITQTKNYIYNPTDSTKYVMGTTDLEYEPNHIQLTKQTTSTSTSGKNKITQYTYPFNYSTAPYTTMVGLNNVTPVIEQSEYSGTNFLQATRTNYDFFQSNTIIAPSSVDLKTGSNDYETRLVYGAYDNMANLQYLVKDGTTKTIYLWSYNKQYPVAKIEGLTYSQLLNYYPQTSVDNLANTANPSADQLTAIRTALASQSALVTTYTYKPLVGMVTATDARGATTNYTYDTFNRLYLARNDDKNIVGRYRYGYQNAPDNGQGGYATLTASVTLGATSYSSGTTGTATLSSLSGGSGNYTYSWYLKNNSATVLASSINTTSTSFSYLCSQTGTLTIQCVITDNLTGIATTVSNNITVTASVTYSCSFTMQSGFNSITSSISCDNSTSTYYIAFYATVAMQVNTSYRVANICSNCRPSAIRTQTFTSGGRTWNITIYPNGYMYFTITSGSALAAGSGTGFGTLTYSK
jgi:hypothetical protein